MLALHELQQRFATAVLGKDDGSFERHIHAAGLTGTQRLQVYRNNTRLGLTGALAAVYPVAQRLVGEGFFITPLPSTSPATPPVPAICTNLEGRSLPSSKPLNQRLD